MSENAHRKRENPPETSREVEELIELAEEAIGYTPHYFREKWNLDARLAKARKALSGDTA